MMTLMIDNNQEVYDTDEIEKLARSVYLKVMETKNINIECQVGVIFTDNKGIQHLNSDFRGVSSPTDVLSFPMLNYESGEIFAGHASADDIDMDTDEVVLGDIVISLERADEQSKEYGHSFEREIAFLLVHGMLHLFGYDHEEEKDRKIMRQEEELILDTLSLRR